MPAKIEFTQDEIQKICHLYSMNEKSCETIGKEFNCSPNVITRILHRNGITKRAGYAWHGVISKEEQQKICQSYLLGMSTPKIAEVIKCYVSTINRILKRNRILIRTNSEAHKGLSIPHKTMRSEEYKKKLSISHKGLQSGKNHPMYGRHHTKEANEKNRVAHSGSNNTLWRGGISFVPYCHKFNKHLREMIKQRDNYQCQSSGCLTTQLESLILYNKSLVVHHVHYDKENCKPDLITLCSSCNSVVNFNRDYWENLFVENLNRRGLT